MTVTSTVTSTVTNVTPTVTTVTSTVTSDGVDVIYELRPDTPAEWTRIARKVLTALDRLIATAAELDPDWQIDLTLGHTYLTATPATTNGDPS